MKKKKIFVVIESLVAAGAEKSLVTFLSLLDYERFEVDLQLLSYGGEFERYIPKEVNLLPPLDYTRFANKNIIAQLLSFDIKKIVARWGYSWAIRRTATFHMDKARLYWKHISDCIPMAAKRYDVAIGYAQGLPTFYVVDKVQADVRLSWVNVSYRLEGVNKDFQRRFYQSIDHIVTVSDSAHEVFRGVYPELAKKMSVIWDIQDPKFMERLAEAIPEKEMAKDVPCLLTIARLNKTQKGYDISLDACRILRDRGVKFKWYAIGRGTYKEEMERYIRENHLEDTFILLGTTPNPYPYIKNATLYVQTSRHEGYGLSIAEARILNTPVVTTEFDAVYNQMVQGKNGLVVKQDSVAVADAVERLLSDKTLYDSIVDYQIHEKKGNTEEIEKFYRLIDL